MWVQFKINLCLKQVFKELPQTAAGDAYRNWMIDAENTHINKKPYNTWLFIDDVK